MSDERIHGTVKWFAEEKGFGFITPDEGSQDVFVHYSAIATDDFRSLSVGERVTFSLEHGPNGLAAVNVTGRLSGNPTMDAPPPNKPSKPNMEAQNTEIRKSWPFTGLPGYREKPKYATYVSFPYDELPKFCVLPDCEFSWLKKQAPVEGSMYEGDYSDGRSPNITKLAKIESSLDVALPKEFCTFIRTPDLHRRIRSNTGCYFDLHDFAVRTYGAYDGYLIHFLSDSQSCLHWYIELLNSGEHFVVVSGDAYGLNPIKRKHRRHEIPEGITDHKREIDLANENEFFFCGDNFTQFMYRFWLENEIWASLTHDEKSLNDEQLHYVNQYL